MKKQVGALYVLFVEMELGTKTKGTCCLSGKYGSGTKRTASIKKKKERKGRGKKSLVDLFL